MGFDYAKDSINKWRENERKILEDICRNHNIEISEPKKSRGYSFTVDEYKKYKTTINNLQEKQSQVTQALEIAKNELQPLQTLTDQLHEVSNIGETKQVGIFKKSTVHTLTDEEYQQLKYGYDKYVANRDSLNDRLSEMEEQKTQFWKRFQNLSKREKTINDYEQLQQKYQKLENKYNSLSKEKNMLDDSLEKLKQTQEKLSTQLENNQYDLGMAYQALGNIIRALGMLKYDGKYQVELSDQANNFIIAIQNYAIHFLKYQNQNILANELNKPIEISKNIQVLINELEKKHSTQQQNTMNNQLKPKKKGHLL